MNVKELILKNRSYRRFFENIRISKEEILDFIELARISPSAKNLQIFKYHIAFEENDCNKIFPLTNWAGFLKDWDGPEAGERPAAYITVLCDKDISENKWNDHGIPTQSILLGAVEKGYGGCIIASFNKNEFKRIFNIPDHFDVIYTIALGKPKEQVVIEKMHHNDHKYWRDENMVHHVPKRPLDEIVLESD